MGNLKTCIFVYLRAHAYSSSRAPSLQRMRVCITFSQDLVKTCIMHPLGVFNVASCTLRTRTYIQKASRHQVMNALHIHTYIHTYTYTRTHTSILTRTLRCSCVGPIRQLQSSIRIASGAPQRDCMLPTNFHAAMWHQARLRITLSCKNSAHYLGIWSTIDSSSIASSSPQQDSIISSTFVQCGVKLASGALQAAIISALSRDLEQNWFK
jgi:hypothetical protein